MRESARVKILLVESGRAVGGTERVVWELATRLPAARFEVHVWLSTAPGVDELAAALAAAELPVTRIAEVDNRWDLKGMLDTWSRLRKLKPDLLHIHHVWPAADRYLEAHLDGTGYETHIATNGEDALRDAMTWKPDVILLDIMMPKLSGFEVCKRLRADPVTKNVGILMVTALDQPTDIERAVEVGTDDFVTRPINKTELLLRVRALLSAIPEPTPTDRTLAYFRRVQHGTLS